VSVGLSRERVIRKFCSTSAHLSATDVCMSAVTIFIIQEHCFLLWMAVDYFVQVYLIFTCKFFLFFLVGIYIYIYMLAIIMVRRRKRGNHNWIIVYIYTIIQLWLPRSIYIYIYTIIQLWLPRLRLLTIIIANIVTSSSKIGPNRFVFGRWPVRNSGGIQAMLTEVLRGSPQSLQTNADVLF
jgi:hypothetical protein